MIGISNDESIVKLISIVVILLLLLIIEIRGSSVFENDRRKIVPEHSVQHYDLKLMIILTLTRTALEA